MKSARSFTLARDWVALIVVTGVLIASVLSAAPQSHERLHGYSNHECAATLISAGSYDHGTIEAPGMGAPNLTAETKISLPHCPLVGSPLNFSLLEHAPPAFC
jgi:hypothetical protein